MAWETRQNQIRRYYTRSVRIDGRVRRQYFGCGLPGQVAAEMDAQDRAERRARTDALRALRRITALADRPDGLLADWVALLMQVVLIPRGYRLRRNEIRRLYCHG
jgi:hypothetical protein